MENGNGNGNMVMPVAPIGNYGYGNGMGGYPFMPMFFGSGGNGGGMGGWDSGWWVILFLFALMGNGFGGWGGMGGFGGGLGIDFPWLMNGQQGINANTNAGFNQAAIQNGINSVQNSLMTGFSDTQLGLAGLSRQVCETGGNITQAISNGFYNAEIADNTRQMANMQQDFALQSQLAQCCCDNRLATANLSALVQSENCADREALSNGVRDIIANQTAGTQRIIDQLCADKIDAKNERIAELQNQLNFANMAASQTAQTARLLADNQAQTQALEQYLNPVPIPAYVVQNPNCCQQNYGCGCSM